MVDTYQHSTSINSHKPQAPNQLLTDVKNESISEDCIDIRSGQMEFLPWDNSHNIVTEEAEIYARRARLYLFLVLFLIGASANVINMAVFFKQGLKDRINLLLLSLALADELFLNASLLLYWEEFTLKLSGEKQVGPMGAFIINNHLHVVHGFGFVSIVLSAVIACERCYCVFNPLKYQTALRTRTTAAIIVAVYVVVMGLYCVSVLRYYFVCAYNSDTGVMSYIFSHNEIYLNNKDLINFVSNIILGSILPVGVTVVVVAATMITVIKLRQAAAWKKETSSSLSSREIALTKMLVGTSLLLIICIVPTVIFHIVRPFLPEVNTGRRKQNFYLLCLRIGELGALVNSSVNIFIYYVMSSRFRETLRVLVKRKAGAM